MGKNKKVIMNNYKKVYFFAIIAILFAFFSKPVDSTAKVKGKCVNCHTMHNSQDGITDPNGPPNASLLTNDCLGCHSNDQESTYYDLDQSDPNDSLVPVVNYTGPDAPTNYLAGGNFWWVKEGNKDADDSKGHNVFPGEGDDKLSSAPGGITCYPNSCHSNFHLKYNVNAEDEEGLYERQGCTGCHMLDDDRQPNGFHHADDGGPYDMIDGSPWYRFLQGHNKGSGHGVSGIEEPNWQPIEGSDSMNHNEYMGKLETNGNKSPRWSISNHTMTGFCCGCHGIFHMQQNAESDPNGPWIRHPSDSVLPNSGEYKVYTMYDPEVPVARPDLSNYSGSNNTNRGIVNPNVDMVMCLSCHRPHGSPFPDILRWNYDDMRVGSGKTNGCFVCHTQKN